MTTHRAREEPARTRVEVEQLLTQMREANERLLVAAVQAQNQSDEAHAEAARARAELATLTPNAASQSDRREWP